MSRDIKTSKISTCEISAGNNNNIKFVHQKTIITMHNYLLRVSVDGKTHAHRNCGQSPCEKLVFITTLKYRWQTLIFRLLWPFHALFLRFRKWKITTSPLADLWLLVFDGAGGRRKKKKKSKYAIGWDWPEVVIVYIALRDESQLASFKSFEY